MGSKDPRPAFTLRFRDPQTHRALRMAADLLGVSMSELAERMIESELTVIGADLERRLVRTAEALRGLRSSSFESDIDEIARAETTAEDPVQARRVARRDPYGVGDVFARRLG